MGGHYGSIQVRTEDRERLIAIATTFAEAQHIRLLVGPLLKGWIGLYPENNGQDENVGRELARRLDDPLLHLLVHDDDIFAYWFYSGGKLIDSFYSLPGYFGEQNRAAEELMAGDPEAFRPILHEKINRLSPLLARGDNSAGFASERLGAFAKALGISNAVQAYEYLKDADRIGVKGWRQFVEIPPERIASDAQSKRKELQNVRAERRELRRDGLLLFSEERKEGIPYGCARDGGFVVAWPDHCKGTVSFSEHRPPWDASSPLELEVPAHITGVVADASGKRIAMAAGGCVRVWDLESGNWNRIRDVPEGDLAIGVAISSDGRRVAHISRREIVVTAIEKGQALCTFAAGDHRQMAFHPNGDSVAVAGSTLRYIRLGETPHCDDLFVGGKSSAAALSEAVFRLNLRDVNLDDLQKRQRDAVDAAMDRLRAMGGGSKTGISEAQIEEARSAMEKQMAEWQSRLTDLKEGRRASSPPQANERVHCVGFSRDGKWFWCGTNVGLRVFEWAKMIAGGTIQLPPPTWKFEFPGTVEFEFTRNVVAIVEEIDAAAVVFAGGTGRLYRLDLLIGAVRLLIKIPGESAIFGLSLSNDGEALGVASNSVSQLRGGPRQRCAWEIWSYPRLLGAFVRQE